MMADDNTPKTMFIVKAKPESLHTAETWLKSKDWMIESTDQIKDALPKILQMKPQFIILCMDHPNQKIRMLPKLFEQAFQIKVIAYLEGTSPSSLASISGMEYVLYPPISGTAIDRMTAKVDRDRRRKQKMDEQRAHSGMAKASLGTTDSGVIAIKGSVQTKEDAMHASEQAKRALMSMMGTDTMIASSGAAQAGESQNLNGLFNEQKDVKAPHITGGVPKDAVNMSASSASPSRGVGAITNEDVEAAVRALHEDAKKKATVKKESDEIAGKTVGAPLYEIDPSSESKRATKKTRTLSSHTNEKKGYTETSGIVLGTQRAIDEIARETPDVEILPLTNTTNAICFFVMSKNHQGFVVCSIAHSPEPLSIFVDMFKNRLTELMADFDKNFLTGPAMEVTIQQVNFDEWVSSQAVFAKKFVHLDRECGVAFFELAPPRPDVAPSKQRDFVQMKLMDVAQDRKLGFNVFLYLPINNKFILYTRRGDKFAHLQKKRLMSRGVSDIHLYESEVEHMHRTHLEAYLDQIISEHYETRNKKTAVSN